MELLRQEEYRRQEALYPTWDEVDALRERIEELEDLTERLHAALADGKTLLDASTGTIEATSRPS